MRDTNEAEQNEHLAGLVLSDLTEDEVRDYGDLTSGNLTSGDIAIVKELECVASLAALAGLDQTEAMPERLRAAITASGRTLVAMRSEDSQAVVELREKFQASRWRETAAWIICLAASILAVVAWQLSVEKTTTQTAQVTRDSLIRTASDLIEVSWTDGKTPWNQPVTGDIVWSNAAQRGFMRFVDMPVNDPSVEQYQLWIIDPSRDDEPIDGGVFDITKPGESIVAIQAKLPVNHPAAFAVTIEKPGGVVVSTQERLPLLAVVP